MGLFNAGYNRPGPGVFKDAPPDNRFVHYWKVLGRHFWDFMKLNLLFCVPAILLLVLSIFLSARTGNLFLSGLPLIAVSPFLAGLVYETRNYIREEHVFVMHDYFSKIKENWKQFFLNGIICYFVYEILSIAIPFYLQNRQNLGSAISVIALAVNLTILLMFTCMQFYIAMQIVTFDMKLQQIYKNAAILAISGLGWNLLAFLITLFFVGFIYFCIWAGQYVPLFLFLLLILAIFLLWSFWAYTVNSLIYPVIDRLMIQPALKKQALERGETGEGTASDQKEPPDEAEDETED